MDKKINNNTAPTWVEFSPTIAAIEKSHGFESVVTSNPYYPDRPAWAFTGTHDFLLDLRKTYEERGKAIPAVLDRFIANYERGDF